MPHKRAKRSVREQLRTQKGVDLPPAKQSLGTEAIPKSIARVLNAAHVRKEWNLKKRKLEDDGEGKPNSKKRKEYSASRESRVRAQGDDGTGTGREAGTREHGQRKSLGIQPGESLHHFNQRVEDDMRPLVKSAMHASLAVSRRVRKAESEAKKGKSKANNGKSTLGEEEARSPSPVTLQKHVDRPKEFEMISSSAPRRLNDIAQAPPEFTKLPRGSLKQVAHVRSGDNSCGGGNREGVLSMAQKLRMEEERENAIVRYREMKASRIKQSERVDE